MPPADQSQATRNEELQPVAAILAALWPGLGHIYLGQTQRGVLAMTGVLGLFFGGLAIGGISCIDRKDFIWFLGQCLVGPPTLVVDYIHQTSFKVQDGRTLRTARPNETRDPKTGGPLNVIVGIDGIPYAKTADGRTISPAYPPYVKSLGRTGELGTLFVTIAGFMNVIVVVDAAFNSRVERRRKRVDTGVQRTLKVPGAGA